MFNDFIICTYNSNFSDWIERIHIFTFKGYAKLRYIDNNLRRLSSTISEPKSDSVDHSLAENLSIGGRERKSSIGIELLIYSY